MTEQPPKAFASVGDLEARWRGLTADEQARATVLLEDASSLVRDSCHRWRQADASTLRRVVCAMVKRAMNSPLEGGEGVSSLMQMAGPFSQQATFSNPAGDLYLSKAERQAIDGQPGGAFEVDLLTGAGQP